MLYSSAHTHTDTHTHTHTHTRLTALFPGLPWKAGTRKVKPIWILLKQETVSGSGISWAICKFYISLQTDNHASTPPLVFKGRMPFLPPNQQRQSTEGTTGQMLIIHPTRSSVIKLPLHFYQPHCGKPMADRHLSFHSLPLHVCKKLISTDTFSNHALCQISLPVLIHT